MNENIIVDNKYLNGNNQSPLQITVGGNKKRSHFKLLSFAELMSQNIEPNWLIEDYIEQDTIGVLYGQSGSYKTFLALDWCLSIATGRSWHGHKVKQGLVVYVAGEGNHGLMKRVKAWQKVHNDDSDLSVPFIASNQRVAILNNDELSVFKHQINQFKQPIALIVFDTLRKCFGSGDENHSKDMGQFLDHIEAIRQEYDTTCLIVHHTNKSKIIRGSNALESDVDFMYKLESKNKFSCALHAEILKDSDAPNPKQFCLMPVHIGSHKGKPINSLVLESVNYQDEPESTRPQGIRGIVFDYILTNCSKAMTWTEIIKNMLNSETITCDEKLTKSIIRTALNGLYEASIDCLDFHKLDGQNAVRSKAAE